MNNRKTASGIQLFFTIMAIALTAIWVCTLTIYTLSIPWLQWSSGLLALFVLYYFAAGGFYYIELTKPDDHFEIKFYNIFPFSREFKMYRIPITAFIKYETQGLKLFKRKLILYQMSSSQMAKYPPIMISALSDKDENDMKIFFKKLK